MTVIRFAVPDDMPRILDLCEKHAEYEQASYSRAGKEKKLCEAIFSKSPRLYCLVAVESDYIFGYATYSLEYSTWDAEEYVHVDCWYLEDKYRNRGIGWRFAKAIGKEAIKLGKKSIQWQTPPFNTKAIKMYDAFGAIAKEKVRFYGDIASWQQFLVSR